ncbi:MAG TPA: thioesterase family protein [Bacteroidota bacterium]|nr:thioesterase family protein [Bacteroidota bacterium]
MDKSKFKHKTEIRVRNYEVDWQGIVHNAVYLQYCELGRVDYLRRLGVKLDLTTIRHDARVVVARNEIDYKSPARFDDALTVWTRVSYIRNTSFGFESIIEESSSGRLVAENFSVHVWLNPRTGEPTTVRDDFRAAVLKFEGADVAILGPTLLT